MYVLLSNKRHINIIDSFPFLKLEVCSRLAYGKVAGYYVDIAKEIAQSHALQL